MIIKAIICPIVAMTTLGLLCSADSNDCIVISGGQEFVFSDPGIEDAVQTLIRITGGDKFDPGLQREGVYKFKKRLGPFLSAKFTAYAEGDKRPVFGGTVKSVLATMITRGQSFAEGVAQLNSVRDIFAREIKSAAFTTTVQTDSCCELSAVCPMPNDWMLTLSVQEKDDALLFRLEMGRRVSGKPRW